MSKDDVKVALSPDGSQIRKSDQIMLDLERATIRYEKMMMEITARTEKASEQEAAVDKYTRYLFRMIAATAVVITLIVGFAGYFGAHHIGKILSSMEATQTHTSELAGEVADSAKSTSLHAANIDALLREIAKANGITN